MTLDSEGLQRIPLPVDREVPVRRVRRDAVRVCLEVVLLREMEKGKLELGNSEENEEDAYRLDEERLALLGAVHQIGRAHV